MNIGTSAKRPVFMAFLAKAIKTRNEDKNNRPLLGRRGLYHIDEIVLKSFEVGHYTLDEVYKGDGFVIRRGQDMKQETVAGMRGGQGEVQIVHILEREKDEFANKGRLYAKNILKPGTSIGLHEHVGDFEAYYILSGEGTVDDNGEQTVVKAGDLVLTRNGEEHSIENKGDADLVFMALILFE